MKTTGKNLLPMIFCLLAGAAPVQAYNLFDFWLSPQGVCTASNPNNSGTFQYQYSAGRSCSVPGRGTVPLYFVAKGTWADESYVAHNGDLVLLTERHPGLCGGSYNYRLWDVNGTYGIKAAQLTFSGYTTWTHPSLQLKCGSTCGSLSTTLNMGAGDTNAQGYLGFIWDQLRDCRSGTCGSPIPMETIFVNSHWAQHTDASCGSHFDVKEEYWYGRADITNDGVSNPQSIGLVRFIWYDFNHTTCSYVENTGNSSWRPYLKNCTLAASCPFC